MTSVLLVIVCVCRCSFVSFQADCSVVKCVKLLLNLSTPARHHFVTYQLHQRTLSSSHFTHFLLRPSRRLRQPARCPKSVPVGPIPSIQFWVYPRRSLLSLRDHGVVTCTIFRWVVVWPWNRGRRCDCLLGCEDRTLPANIPSGFCSATSRPTKSPMWSESSTVLSLLLHLLLSGVIWGLLEPRTGSVVVRIDLLHFLARCRKRQLNQALSVLSHSLGFFWCMCCAVN